MSNDEHGARRIDMRPIETVRDGAEDQAWVVSCPRQGRLLPFAECIRCERLTKVGLAEYGASGAFIECDHGVEGVDQRALASTLPVSTIARGAVCVSPDLGLEALGELLVERGLGGAPVVDAERRLLGVVTKTDLVRRRIEWVVAEEAVDALPAATVSEIMTPLACSLRDDATVGEAATLMAKKCIHTLPLTTENGEIVGVVTALDILAWVGRRESGH